MKKILLITLTFVSFFTIGIVPDANAQIFDRIKRKVQDKVNNKIDKTIDDATDGKKNKPADTETKTDKKSSSKTEPPSGSENADSTRVDEKTTADIPNDSGMETYKKFDFIPGNRILFYDDFTQDNQGDFPAHWNTNGGGEIVMDKRDNKKWFEMKGGSDYAPLDEKHFPKNYTIEFDLGRNTGDDAFKSTGLSIHFSDKSSFSYDNSGYLNIKPFDDDTYIGVTNTGNDIQTKINNAVPYRLKNVSNVQHFSIAVNGSRLRLWLGENKILDLPTLLRNKEGQGVGKYIYFSLGMFAKGNEPAKLLLGNFRIAEAGEDIRSQLMTKGKFSTNGIYFATNSADLKPQSNGILKAIADVLQQEKSMNLKITGYTDSDGDAGFNLTLSQKRAEAVKNALVKDYHIEATRLKTEGKGETEPVADNNTAEGKASNRRVEFIKQSN
ncbi:MAG: OmpA family protein [Ginsengibacter sp.]